MGLDLLFSWNAFRLFDAAQLKRTQQESLTRESEMLWKKMYEL